MNEEDFSTAKSVPTALRRAMLVRSCLMDIAGSQKDQGDGFSFSASGFSVEKLPNLAIEERQWMLPSVIPVELFLMLPTDTLPYLHKQQIHRLLEFIKMNVKAFVELGFKTIAMSLESNDIQKRDKIFEELGSMLLEMSSNKFDEFDRVTALGNSLLFLARFNAYCWAHIHLTGHDQGNLGRCIPEEDAAKALGFVQEMVQRFKAISA